MEWFQQLGVEVGSLGLKAVQAPFRADERIYWVYLLSAAILAAAVFFERQRRQGQRFSLRGFVSYAFPKKVYAHPSARVDYRFLVLNRVLFSLFAAPLVVGSAVSFTAVHDLLDANFDGGALAGSPTAAFAAVSVVSLVGLDVGLFVAHFLQHRVPLLWEFHKVHHSAQVLTPFTVYRMHPIDNVLSLTLSGAFAGAAGGAIAHLALGPVSFQTVATLNVGLFLFYLVGYNLRHSHIWLHYGPGLSRLVISPAQHQIHHSVDRRHFDKNFGFMLAVWDRVAGTLYVPQEEEELKFGLPNGEDEAFSSVWALYTRPFRQALHLLRHSLPLQVGVVLVLGGIVLASVGPTQGWVPGASDGQGERRVWVEELTSSELEARVSSGWTTVIVPTGGLEQNGPHMVLGKHRLIVEHTAEAIARSLGKTLVAPVLDYVPEGAINPPSGHMHWPGTVSLPEPVFGSVLKNIAASLKQHGFKTICLLGDSGDSQQMQRAVAEELDARWRAQGVRVVHVGEYYDLEPQIKWLEENGETSATIGRHAGIRDTSELLAVHPEGVRTERIAPGGGSKNSGVDGDPTRASRKRGRALLRLKIDAAVKAIDRARSNR